MDLEIVIENDDPLHCARTGNVEFFRRVDVNVILEFRSNNGESVLSIAAQENHIACVEEINKRCPSLLTFDEDNYGKNALHHAVSRGNIEIVKLLLRKDDYQPVHEFKEEEEEGEELEDFRRFLRMTERMLMQVELLTSLLTHVDHANNTPLHVAVQGSNFEMVEVLIHAYPEFEYPPNNSGDTPLRIAIRKALSGEEVCIKIRKLLLEVQPNSSKLRNKDNGWTALHYAASIGDISAIEDILQACRDSIEIIDNKGKTFLQIAIESDHLNVVSYLFQREDHIIDDIQNIQKKHTQASPSNSGTEPQATSEPQETSEETNVHPNADPILCASTGDVDFFRRVASDVILKSRNSNGASVLSIAAKHDQLACCQEICKKCPFLIYHQENDGSTALHHAVWGGNLEIVKLILSAGDETLSQKEGGIKTEVQGVHLLRWKTDRHRTGQSFRTRRITDYVQVRVTRMVDQDGNTALHLAVQVSYEIVKVLLLADLMFEYPPNNSGDTPLTIAMQEARSGDQGSIEIRKLLLEEQPKSSKVRIITGSGWTPLHYAASEKDLDSIEIILRVCPDSIEIVDNAGQTFLHIAAELDHGDIVRYILQKRDLTVAFLNRKDDEGHTPLHCAAINGCEVTALLLLYDDRISKTSVDIKGQTLLDAIKFGYDRGRAGLYSQEKGYVVGDQKELKEQRTFDLLVCALIATVSFTAGITVPGGFASDGKAKGTAVLSREISFKVFIISNTLALMFSLYTMFSSFSTRNLLKQDQVFFDDDSKAFRTRLLIKSKDIVFQLNVSTVCTLFAIYAMVVAFLTGSYAVLENSHALAITVCAISGCFFISAFHAMGVMAVQYFKSPR